VQKTNKQDVSVLLWFVIYQKLLSGVELTGYLALLASSCILMQNTLSNSLVDSADCSLESFVGLSGANFQSCIKLLQLCLQCRLSSTILLVLHLAYENTLLSRLNVRQNHNLLQTNLQHDYHITSLTKMQELFSENFHIFFAMVQKISKILF